jgi:hypothetical protein
MAGSAVTAGATEDAHDVPFEIDVLDANAVGQGYLRASAIRTGVR